MIHYYFVQFHTDTNFCNIVADSPKDAAILGLKSISIDNPFPIKVWRWRNDDTAEKPDLVIRNDGELQELRRQDEQACTTIKKR